MRFSNASDAEVVIYSLKRDSSKVSIELEVNVSNFRDPLGHKTLTKQYNDGRAAAVLDWMKEDPRLAGLLNVITLHTMDKMRHGKQSHLVMGFRDIHGKWISPAVAEIVADHLDKLGFNVGVIHDGLKVVGGQS